MSNIKRELLLKRDEDIHLGVDYYGGEDGPFMLILPGGNGGIRKFEPLAKFLCGLGMRVAAMNYRGAGKSTGPGDNITLHDFGADAAVVINHFAPEATVIGYSAGNRVGRIVAYDHPELVSNLILLAPGGHVPPDPANFDRMMEAVNDTLPMEQRLLAAKDVLFAPGNKVPDDYFLDNGSSTAATNMGNAIEGTKDTSWHSGGGKSILIIHGSHDQACPVANAQYLKDKYPDTVTLRIVDNAGHAVLTEKPEEVTQLVEERLRDLGIV